MHSAPKRLNLRSFVAPLRGWGGRDFTGIDPDHWLCIKFTSGSLTKKFEYPCFNASIIIVGGKYCLLLLSCTVGTVHALADGSWRHRHEDLIHLLTVLKVSKPQSLSYCDILHANLFKPRRKAWVLFRSSACLRNTYFHPNKLKPIINVVNNGPFHGGRICRCHGHLISRSVNTPHVQRVIHCIPHLRSGSRAGQFNIMII